MQELGDLSSKVVVLLGSSGFPEHDSAKDVGVLVEHVLGDGLQSARVDVSRAGRVGAGRSADQDLDVLVDRDRLGPVGPGVEVELARVLVESAVVVVKLNPDVIEPGVGEGESLAGSHPVVGVGALRSRSDVVSSRSADEISSELVDKLAVSDGVSVLDVEIDSINDGVSEGSNRSVSTEESVPDESGKCLCLRSRSETIVSTRSSKREENLLALALTKLDVSGDSRA